MPTPAQLDNCLLDIRSKESASCLPLKGVGTQQASDQIVPGRELVVLAHGIASTRWVLSPLAKRLRKAGYATKLYGYPSVWWSTRSHGRKLAKVLRRAAHKYDKIHVVGHSMGGIVSRCALEEELPENFGRVVMIAPPNRGSHVATRRAWWQSWAVPTLLELRDTPCSLVNQMGPLPHGHEVGVLAASKDSVLRPGQTEVEGQADHLTVEGHHSGILWTQETADLTRNFLLHGAFIPTKVSTPIITFHDEAEFIPARAA